MENGHGQGGSPRQMGGQAGGDSKANNSSRETSPPAMIPFLSACFAELRAKGLHEPRLFQHPASLTDIRQLWQSVCRDGVHKLKEQENPHLIAGLVVWHLKRQPEPLVPYSLYSLVVAAGAGAAAAAEAAARRLQHGSEQSHEDDREEGEDDLDEDDEEADRGGGRGLGGEGGIGGGVAQADGMGKMEGEGSGLGSGVMGPRGAGVEAAKKAEDGGVDENGSPKAAEGEAAAGGTVTRTIAGNEASETTAGSSEKTTDGANVPVATDAASRTTPTLNNSAKPTSPNSAKPASPTNVLTADADAKMTSKYEKHAKDSMPPGSLWDQAGAADVEWGVKGAAGARADGNAEAGAGAGGGGGVGARGGGGGEWDAVDGTVALRHLQNLAAQLPYGAWQVLCLLFEFLAQVAALSKVNEMTSEALAQPFAPVLCRPQGSAFMSLRHVQDLVKIQAVVRVLIDNHTILSQNRIASNHSTAGNKTLMAGQARGGGKDGLGLTLSPGGRRASSSDLYLVQQLINDSVSLLVYSGSEGEEEGEESDGSLRGGAGEGSESGGEKGGSGWSGRRRARPGGLGCSQGRLSSFLRPHMLHAPPQPHHGPGVAAAGTGPAYLRKHSFFDLDEDEDDEEFESNKKKEAGSTAAGSSSRTGPSWSDAAQGQQPSQAQQRQQQQQQQQQQEGNNGFGSSKPDGSGSNPASLVSSPASPSPTASGSDSASATTPLTMTTTTGTETTATLSYAAATAAGLTSTANKAKHAASSSSPKLAGSGAAGGDDPARAARNAGGRSGTGGANVKEAGKNNDNAGGRGGGGGAGAHGSAAPLMRGGRRAVAGAMERRRMMQACRTLRAQINHYETAFQQEYGHAPRGRERSPLVSTYAQYKSWKQFIRDDASTQIQAFYRGYRERQRHPEVPRLLRHNAPPPPPPPSSSSITTRVQHPPQQQQQSAGGSPSPPRIDSGLTPTSLGGAALPSPAGRGGVVAKGGLSSPGSDARFGATAAGSGGIPGSLLSPLSVRTQPSSAQQGGMSGGFGNSSPGATTNQQRPQFLPQRTLSTSPSSSAASTPGGVNCSGSTARDAASGSGPPGSGEWDSASPWSGAGKSSGPVGGPTGGADGVSESTGGGGGALGLAAASAVGTGLTVAAGEGGGGTGGGVAGGMGAAEEEARGALTTRLTQLLDEKRRIKAQLKEFDMNFFGRSGRLPTKAEKEPMRHLYDKYNGLKHQIRDVEGLLAAHRQQHSPHLQYTPPQSPYTASPRGGWTTASSVAADAAASNSMANAQDSRSNSSYSNGPATTGARSGAVVGSPSSVAGAVAASAAAAAAAAASAAAAAAAAGVGGGERGGGAAERLEQLKKEKRMLHVMLKNFEKDFKERNGREVNCPEDIAPVEGEYQKYKLIKRRLAQMSKA